MLITYHGRSRFLLETASGFSILLDPVRASAVNLEPDIRADAILLPRGPSGGGYSRDSRREHRIIDRSGEWTLAPELFVCAIPCIPRSGNEGSDAPSLMMTVRADGLTAACLAQPEALDESLLRMICGADILFMPINGLFPSCAPSAAALLRRVSSRILIPIDTEKEGTKEPFYSGMENAISEAGIRFGAPLPLLRVTKEDLCEQPRIAVLLRA